jgi:hypothetical protein
MPTRVEEGFRELGRDLVLVRLALTGVAAIREHSEISPDELSALETFVRQVHEHASALAGDFVPLVYNAARRARAQATPADETVQASAPDLSGMQLTTPRDPSVKGLIEGLHSIRALSRQAPRTAASRRRRPSR